MSNDSSTVLAIAPGTRELGIAVIQNGELLFYGVKTVNNRRSPQAILEGVSVQMNNLIKKYRPTHLAIEEIIIRQSSYALVAVVAEQIKAVAKVSQLPFSEYVSASVRKRLCETERATKRATAEVLVSRFPELRRYHLRATKGERDYYDNLFDAVALGVICEEALIKGATSNEANLSANN